LTLYGNCENYKNYFLGFEVSKFSPGLLTPFTLLWVPPIPPPLAPVFPEYVPPEVRAPDPEPEPRPEPEPEAAWVSDVYN
jgi:hypothetical protein